jgi:ferredoxin
MAYVITEDCTNCGACEAECPVECIKEEGGKYFVVKEDCTDCGICADICPLDAIKPE